ncbi:MAG: leucine-rich repeat protein [Eubacterium sp.]|nr:leucine-rich repeat protein [Eubacterium sp.]
MNKVKRRKLAFLLAVALLFGTVGVLQTNTGNALAISRNNSNEWEISTYDDLLEMAAMIEGVSEDHQGSYARDTFVLKNDIVAPSDDVWLPIGQDDDGEYIAFSGTFDGKGHKISGLKINIDDEDYQYIGFFSKLEGTVKNITFENCSTVWDTESENNNVQISHMGIIAGDASGANINGVTVNNCNIVPENIPAEASVVMAGVIAGQAVDASYQDVMLSNNNYNYNAQGIMAQDIGQSDTRVGVENKGGTYDPFAAEPVPGSSQDDPSKPSDPSNPSNPSEPPAQGDEITKNDITYQVGTSNNVTVTSVKDTGIIKIPSTFKQGGVKFKVTKIAPKVFKKHKNVKKIYLPDTVVDIGDQAMADCPKLQYVSIGENRKAVSTKASSKVEESNLAFLPVSAKVNIKIGAKVFMNCVALKKVIINIQVTKIGDRAFIACKKLSSIVVYSKQLKTVGNKALQGVHNCKISVLKKKLKPYRKLFKNKGQGKKVVVAKM